ncbi:diguanylate cyclase (GGDEF)-like protein/PAS domain S-box-containing protein [Bacillus tianshenii]|uniref:Diguanylate cyclase (GGDEF)-like protein/PAS domain S-box-containing protein n=1 Tax=Sutcliffiella tianshenii TaxID=1463404 RepID=A0ABS2NUY6_9BACI|nr:PAS domain S-box protein [Bacillus tianshenii]MBM7618468.1 diguanylate cyclase (GGDEF)-like protein/PAS domain S-box-containing protein [Bacillus tianshenii]
MRIEEKFQFFFEHMVDMVFLVEWKEDSFWYKYVNASAQQKLVVEMIGRKLEDVLPASTYELLHQHYSVCVEKMESVSYSDLNLFVPDMPASETTLTPIKDGDHIYVLAITKNVNELKKKAEDYLFLNSLVANTVDAMMVVDTNSNILKINNAFEKQFGWTKSEMIGKHWKDFPFSSEKLKAQTEETIRKLQDRHSVMPMETIRLTKDGQTIHTSVSYSPIFDKEGNVAAVSMIYRNIQHLRELEAKLAESKDAYKSLFSYHKNAILMIDSKGLITNVNDACEDLTGYKKELIVGVDFKEYVNKELRLPNDPIQQALDGHVTSYEIEFPHLKGNMLYFYVTHVPIIIKGAVTGSYIIAQDITEKKEMERALKDSEEKFRLITEHSSDLIKVVDKSGTVSYASPSYRNLLGTDYEKMIGKYMTYGVHEMDHALLMANLQKLQGTKHPVQMEFRYLDQSNEEIWVEVNATSIAGNGDFDQIVLTGRIISERKQLQEMLTYQAYHDSLTSLPNRRLLERSLESAIDDAIKNNGKLALLFMDCDNFKQINDTYGHDLGDMVLVELSKRLSKCVRSEDTVARLGGDEFVILIKHVENIEHVNNMAERIQTFLQKPYWIEGKQIKATTSIGISIFPENGTTIKQLFRRADQALYQVKNNGRNDYQLFS